MSLCYKVFHGFGFGLVIFFILANKNFAQDVIDVVDGKKEAVWRLGFWEVLHQTFSGRQQIGT